MQEDNERLYTPKQLIKTFERGRETEHKLEGGREGLGCERGREDKRENERQRGREREDERERTGDGERGR